MVTRLSLEECLDPEELIPGELRFLMSIAESFQDAAQSAASIASMLLNLQIAGWAGPASQAFHATVSTEGDKWATTATAMWALHGAAEEYRQEFRLARMRADEAAELFRWAAARTTAARQEHTESGATEPFRDPSVGARAEAEDLLRRARRLLSEAGDAAEATFGAIDRQRPNASVGWGVLGIAQLSPSQLASYADFHADLVDTLAGLGPDAIHAWWASLDPAERKKLLATIPEVLGNLEGVDYADRSTANRAVLLNEQALLRKVAKDDPGYQAARAKLNAIDAILKTLGKHPEKAAPPLQLIILDLSGPTPKAAISVGDMDLADHITYNVPGMGTTVAKDMLDWKNASKNLYQEQLDLARSRLSKVRPAVVAFIGYEAPQDFWQENGSDFARTGGAELAKALNGTLATRGWPPQSANLSVVGFSYGSTTAGEALKIASAGSFVSVGSAGFVPAPFADPFNVPTGHTFAGQAGGDSTAELGRNLSARRGPADYGARPFSANDAQRPDGTRTAGTTDHVATVHSSDPGKYGYYDSGTTSLNNMAAESMGYLDQVAK